MRLTCFLLSSAFFTASHAADFDWDGSQNNNWDNNPNWSGASGWPNGLDDNAHFTDDQRNDVDIRGKVALVRSIVFNTPHVDDFQFVDNSGGGLLRVFNNITGTNAARHHVFDANVEKAGNGIIDGNGTVTINGTLSGSGNIERRDSGRLVLNTANSWSGALTITGGKVRLGNNFALQNSVVTVSSNDGLDLAFNNASARVAGLQGANTLNLGTGTLTVNASANRTYSGVIRGSGGLTKSGTGALTLSAANTYNGTTRINGGSVKLGAALALQNSTVSIGSGSLDINGLAPTIGGLAGSGNLALGTNTLTLGGNGSNTTYSGVMSGSGLLIKTGAGTTSLHGNNSFSGNLLIESGAIGTNASGRLGSKTVIFHNATLELQAAFALANNISFANATAAGFVTTNFNNSYSGSIGGGVATNGLIKDGSGTLDFTANPMFPGSIVVRGGQVIARNTLLAAAGLEVQTDGGLDVTTDGAATEIGSLAGSGDLNAGGQTLTFGGDDRSTIYSGEISGSGELIKTGTGTFSLRSNNPFTGTFTIEEGLLHLTEGFGLYLATVRNDADGGINLGGVSAIFGHLAGTGDFDIGSADLSVGNNQSSRTFSGSISGSGDVTKFGNGAWTVDGDNTFTGLLKVNAGTLLGTGSTAGDLSVTPAATISPATFGVGGDADIDGTYRCEIDGGSGDQIAVAGQLDITGSTLDIDVLATASTGYYPIARYGSLVGTFASVQGLPAGCTLDYAYDDGGGDLTISIIKDVIAPTVTITASETSPTNADSITYNLTFSEPVFGLNATNDFYLTGTTHATVSLDDASVSSAGDDINFTITLGMISGDGFLQFRLRRNAITDAYGNPLVINAERPFDPFSPGRTIDNTAPVITLNGAANITQTVGDPWSDPGASTDDHSTATTGGDNVNTVTPGNYTITYNATDAAGNTATEVTRTVTIITHYDSWATSNGLTGNGALNTSDPDADGRTNLEEFATDGDPNSGVNNGKVHAAQLDIGGQDYYSITHPVRDGAVFAGSPSPTATIHGITYTFLGGIDLDTADSPLVEVTPAADSGLPAVNPGWSYRTFRFESPSSSAARAFLHVDLSD